jgi:hypothetical protein
MSRSYARPLLFVVVAFSIASLGEVRAQQAQRDVDEQLGMLEMRWERPSERVVAERIIAVAEVMLQRRIDREEARKALAPAISGHERGSWTRFEVAPELLVRYLPEVDEIRVLNEELTISNEVRGSLGEQQIVELAGRYLRELGTRRALDAALYDLRDAEIGYGRAGAGQVTGVREYDRIVEFRVTLRPRINGIEVANAGVRLGIRPTGELVSLRFGGVSMRPVEGESILKPEREGTLPKQEVPKERIKARFYRSLPQGVAAEIHWERVMYVMPEDRERAVVQPLYVLSYSEVREVDGEPIVSRRKVIGYSLTDPEAGPVDLSPVRAKDIEQGQRPERRPAPD